MTDTIEATQVILWSKPSCPQCNATERAFKEQDIAFVKLDISQPENAAQLAHFKNNYGFAQAPIVETPDDAWCGFQPDRIKDLANRIGGNA